MQQPLASISHYVSLLTARKTPALLCILLLGFAVRTVMTIGTAGILWPDSLHYYRSAMAIASQWNFNAHPIYHTPLYPLFLSFFLRFGETAQVGTLIIATQHLLGLLSTYLVFLVANRLFSTRISLFAALLFTLQPLTLYYESVVQTETLFTLMLLLTTYTTLRVFEHESRIGYLSVGVISALLTLTRPLAQFYVFAVPLLLLLIFRAIRPCLPRSGLVLLGYVVTLLPWLAINFDTYGFVGVSKGAGLNLYLRVLNIDELPPVADSAYPHIKEAYAKLHITGRKDNFTMQHWIQSNLRLSTKATDELMLAFAVETLLARPTTFALNTVHQFLRTFYAPRQSVRICPSEYGRYLCSKIVQQPSDRHARNIMTTFPQRPRAEHPLLQKLVYLYFSAAIIPMVSLVILAIWGGLRFFIAPSNRRWLGMLLICAITYFPSMTALLNVPEDRFRLPVDPFIFMFACYGCAELVKVLDRGRYARLALHGPEVQPPTLPHS